MKKSIIIILLCFLAASCASVSKKDEKTATYHYQLGISYLNDNNIQPAFVEFQKALELNPGDKNIHHVLGVIYFTKLEDYPKAIKHFQRALQIDPEFSEAATNLGNAYATTGDYDKAIESYKRALTNPQYENAAKGLFNMGMAYYRLARYEDALDSFTKAVRRFSDFYQPYYGMALTFNAMGQYGDASTAMSRAIELDPLYKGDRKKAAEDLKLKKLTARSEEKKDISDYLEIFNY